MGKIRSHRRSIVVTTVLIAVCLTGLVLVKQFISGSAEGSISVAQPAKKELAEPTALVAERGTYASFNYPAVLQPVKNETAVSPVLTNYSYVKSQFGSWQLSIQISTLPTGNLNDNGSYHYRKSVPGQYIFTSQIIKDKAIPLVTDKTSGAFNRVAYLVGSGKVATVSLMGGNGQDEERMNEALQTILSSWQWR
jgi:hypothetical protein